MNRASLFRIYEKLAARITPGLVHPQSRYRDILDELVQPGCTWLDLGCGHDVVPHWLENSKAWQIAKISSAKLMVGIDGSYSSLIADNKIPYRIQGNIETLPFRDRSFSVITSNMVVEHVQEPHTMLGEVFRVLNAGGIFVFHTVNILGYRALLASLTPEFLKKPLIKFFENREEEDVFPTCYQMNKKSLIESLGRKAGFGNVEVRLIESTPQAWMLGPLVIPELIWIRMLRMHPLRRFQTNLVVVMRKT
jgi:ubiquinone/menaquinone biosynthesis C-methylase UbiE